MGTLAVEKHINAPVERVFERAMDLESWPEHIEGILAIDKKTDGPVGNGTEFSETRVMFGKEHSETMTFADVVTNKGYTLVSNSCGSYVECVHTLTPTDGGTTLRLEFISKPVTLTAKLMSPLGILMKGTMKKMINKDFDDLARACESQD
jgi:uncharacterized protein YndB with AHSA1/START domain